MMFQKLVFVKGFKVFATDVCIVDVASWKQTKPWNFSKRHFICSNPGLFVLDAQIHVLVRDIDSNPGPLTLQAKRLTTTPSFHQSANFVPELLI